MRDVADTRWLVRRAAIALRRDRDRAHRRGRASRSTCPDTQRTRHVRRRIGGRRLVPVRLRLVPRHRRPRLLIRRGRSSRRSRSSPAIRYVDAPARATDRQHAARARSSSRGSPGLATLLLFARWCAWRLERRAAMLAVACFALYPYGWFLYGAGYGDALFLALAIGAFVLLEDDHPVLAGLAGAAAAVTRPIGIAVAVGLLLRAIERRGGLPASRRQRAALREARDPGPAGRAACSAAATSGCCSRPLGLIAWSVLALGALRRPVRVLDGPGGVGPGRRAPHVVQDRVRRGSCSHGADTGYRESSSRRSSCWSRSWRCRSSRGGSAPRTARTRAPRGRAPGGRDEGLPGDGPLHARRVPAVRARGPLLSRTTATPGPGARGVAARCSWSARSGSRATGISRERPRRTMPLGAPYASESLGTTSAHRAALADVPVPGGGRRGAPRGRDPRRRLRARAPQCCTWPRTAPERRVTGSTSTTRSCAVARRAGDHRRTSTTAWSSSAVAPDWLPDARVGRDRRGRHALPARSRRARANGSRTPRRRSRPAAGWW